MTKIEERNVEEELKTSYLTYAMSVNTNRAIPDARDGLKPSNRRIIYAMNQIGLNASSSYDKCAAVVGEVMKNFHPHGDAAIYSTLVGLVQDFSIRYPLIDGQGNFGSIDDDPAGAMRYTECKMTALAGEMLVDIQKNTVDFQPNYKDSIEEPTVLPGLVPNLLVNGTTGIGVGYLTRMPPHNLGEVVNAILLRLEQPNCTIDQLMKCIPGPDFPTGGIIIGKQGISDIYTKGKGGVIIRAKTSIERNENNRNRIIITEIPYQVKKNVLLEKIYQLVVDKTITGISDIRDESDKEIRIIIDLKRGEVPEVILNQLFKHSELQKNYNAIMLALVDGAPCILTLDQILDIYINHRIQVIYRRCKFDLDKAQKRAHILEGYLKALQHLEEIIVLIKESENPNQALNDLQEKYELSQIQAREILNMTLRQLTKIESGKVQAEYDSLLIQIEKLKEILDNEVLIRKIIKTELIELKNKYSDERKTDIIGAIKDFQIEDLLADEQVVVVLSHKGYIKRMPLSNYKRQHRGGTGTKGLKTKEGDFVKSIFTTTAHQYILFFTNIGRCYGLKAFQIPEGSRQSVGRPVINLLPKLNSDEKIMTAVSVREFSDKEAVLMVTKKGLVKKCGLDTFSNPRVGGINIIKLIENDELVDAQITKTEEPTIIVLITTEGYYSAFKNTDIRVSGRNTQGRLGIRAADKDFVSRMIISESEDKDLLIITSNGYGKRSKVGAYSVRKKPGAKSVKAVSQQDSGNVVAADLINNEDEIFILNSKGNITRISVKDIPTQGRTARGVKIMKLQAGETLIDAGKIIE